MAGYDPTRIDPPDPPPMLSVQVHVEFDVTIEVTADPNDIEDVRDAVNDALNLPPTADIDIESVRRI